MLKWAMPPAELRGKVKEHSRLVREKELAVRQNEFKRAGRLRDKQRELESEIEFETESWREAGERAEKVVGIDDVAEVVSGWTGIPVKALSVEEMQNLLRMEEALHKRVVGQEEAIATVSRAIRRSYAKVKDPSRPIGSFMFLGPTGVGKTLLARALAEFLFNDDSAMVRIDMSEYTERFSVSRLVGAPPGYVGYDEGGQLTESVRRRPYSVVLLDEIEKAHPDVFNMLLQVMDDGRMTDSQGRVVNFKNAVIIMTSNLGLHTTDWRTPLGFRGGKSDQQDSRDYDDMKSKVLEAVKKTFRPEFLNRLDASVVFRPLTNEQLRDIVELELARLGKQLLEQELTLVVSDAVKEKLAAEGFDANLGARPLKRAIQQLVEDPLSEALLSGTFKPGDEVVCSLEGSVVVVKPQEQEPVCASEETS
jgi:ATP-dependent Clp protease ATP-binding subunit ClpC